MRVLWLILVFSTLAVAQRTDQLRFPTPPFASPDEIRTAVPEYTPEARAAGLQGTVSLYLEIDPDGNPSKVAVLHGLGLGLDEKAVQAVRQWHFRPATQDGQPVRIGRSTDIDFHLDGGGPWRVRLAAYRVMLDRRRSEVFAKPVLTSYTAPESGVCPAEGGRAVIGIVVGTDGIPRVDRPLTSSDQVAEAAAKAIESWRYVPGTADGKPRESHGWIEFECGPSLPAAGNTVTVRGMPVTQPTVVFKADPEYDEEARKAKLSGTVVLRVIVDPTGHATHIEVVKTLGMGLDEKAVEAVEEWRFKPGMKGGLAVNVRATIEVNFRLL